ncbi:MAG TPA: cupin domain-containing protein [Steroidobacteraceae bacterium]|jgi:hypothetical protein|nr:cupin domain-containing protein [Steroidobacteraceae bacterium]
MATIISETTPLPLIRPRGEAANWVSCPVNAAWVLEGAPVARIEHLSTSADGTASTYFWDCTAGRFNWFYSFDETLHILEGAVSLKYPTGETRHVVAGDVVFFPKGSHAEWTVQNYVRKLAFCRTTLPGFVISARDVVRKMRRFGRSAPATGGAGGVFSAG